MIVFECPSCKKKLQAADQHAGKAIRCPHCQAVATVPVSADEAAVGVTAAPSAPPAPPPNAVTSSEDAPSSKSRRDRDDDDDDDKPSKARRKRDDDDDEDDDGRPRKRRRDREPASPVKTGMGIGMILLIVCGVGCCVVGPIMVALLVPAVQKVREAAARTHSTNNLKQISIAFHGYHDAHRRMPFNGTQVANPNVPDSGSWAYQILPFIEQAPMFQMVNRNSGVPTYLCPSRGRPQFESGGGAWTDYFFNNYANDPDNASLANAPSKKRSLVGFTDGTSNTVIVGHGNVNIMQYTSPANVTLSTNIFDGGKAGTMRAGNNGRTNPNGWTLMRDSMANPTIGSWGGPFPQGALMAMGDGTVRMFPYTMQNFGAALTPDGGEAIMIPDF